MSLVDKFKLSMSPEALRAKYAEERERRLRSDGNAQYKELKGAFKEFDNDPYVTEAIVRDPIIREHEVVVVGGGFGGMLQAAHLRKQGIDDFVMIEAGGDFGGTWYWNRYPGAACDVESYIYLPLLDDTGYVPTEKYVKAPEIHAYCQLLARHFRLYEAALFQTKVVGAHWDEAAKRWIVATDRGDQLSARHLVIAGGILHKAKLPAIDGIEGYQGHAFHTSRWDYDYTGGSPTSFMNKLVDKKVGIIGTGATSLQAVPRLAEAAGHLYVFQRTPSTVGPRNNRPTDPEWAASLKPGWQKERLENFVAMMSGRKLDNDMVADGWTDIFKRDGAERASGDDELEAAAELADMERMEEIRARVDEIVKDPETAAALKPWYGHMCKRPGFHDEYLQAFNRPNVTLVDTHGQGVRQMSPRGIVVNDREIPLDLVIFASGFEVTTEFTRRMGFDPVGPDGLHLSTAWKEGAETLHGTVVRGFPNLYVISLIQGGQMANFVQMIHEAAIHIAHIVGWATKNGIVTLQPKKEAAGAWLNTIFGTLMGSAGKYSMACTPGYYNNEGQAADIGAAKRSPYMGKPDEFLRILGEWRANHGEEQDLEVTRDQ